MSERVTNAVIHSEPGSPTLDATLVRGRLMVQFADTGPGLRGDCGRGRAARTAAGV